MGNPPYTSGLREQQTHPTLSSQEVSFTAERLRQAGRDPVLTLTRTSLDIANPQEFRTFFDEMRALLPQIHPHLNQATHQRIQGILARPNLSPTFNWSRILLSSIETEEALSILPRDEPLIFMRIRGRKNRPPLLSLTLMLSSTTEKGAPFIFTLDISKFTVLSLGNEPIRQLMEGNNPYLPWGSLYSTIFYPTTNEKYTHPQPIMEQLITGSLFLAPRPTTPLQRSQPIERLSPLFRNYAIISGIVRHRLFSPHDLSEEEIAALLTQMKEVQLVTTEDPTWDFLPFLFEHPITESVWEKVDKDAIRKILSEPFYPKVRSQIAQQLRQAWEGADTTSYQRAIMTIWKALKNRLLTLAGINIPGKPQPLQVYPREIVFPALHLATLHTTVLLYELTS